MSRQHAISALRQRLLDLLYPRQCYGCQCWLTTNANVYLCWSCWRSLGLFRGPLCHRCGQPQGPYLGSSPACCQCSSRSLVCQRISAAGPYEGLLRNLIQAFKYQGQRNLAPLLARLLDAHLQRYPLNPPPQVIVPVPLFYRDLWRRGYNQAALLAQELGRRVTWPVYAHTLVKIRPTKRQVGLSQTARQQNLQDAFAVRGGKLQGKVVLLVDDVITTATTIRQCARTLQTAGARIIYAVAVARA